jgi:hypothetical protein
MNDTDPSVHLDSRQITVVQHVLQNHICTSLGDSIESLCWQKSASSVMSKSSIGGTGKVNTNSSIGTGTTQRVRTKHRRSSTLPTHRRVDEFASLQYNLHPFSTTPIEALSSRNNDAHKLTKSQSFQQTSKHCNKNSATNTHTDISLVSTEWECGALDFASAFESRDELGTNGSRCTPTNNDMMVNSDSGYESDPEIICRKVKTDRWSNEDKSQPSHTLQEFLNERNTFIWHTITSKSIAVHVWIELGQQLYDRLLMPKLCWKPILATPTGSETKRTSIGTGTVSSMDLLSICRIRQIVNSDRKQYPFAQTQRLFSIHSTVDKFDAECSSEQQHQNIILEARSIADRIRFTNLLKLTVSNLAAKFITNDPNTLTMFFHNPTIADYVA